MPLICKKSGQMHHLQKRRRIQHYPQRQRQLLGQTPQLTVRQVTSSRQQAAIACLGAWTPCLPVAAAAAGAIEAQQDVVIRTGTGDAAPTAVAAAATAAVWTALRCGPVRCSCCSTAVGRGGGAAQSSQLQRPMQGPLLPAGEHLASWGAVGAEPLLRSVMLCKCLLLRSRRSSSRLLVGTAIETQSQCLAAYSLGVQVRMPAIDLSASGGDLPDAVVTRGQSPLTSTCQQQLLI